AGVKVKVIGAVGDDDFGHTSLNHLQREGMETSLVDMLRDVSTGVAYSILKELAIAMLVAAGANFEVTTKKIAQAEEQIRTSDIVLLQLELPLETVTQAIHIAHKHNVPVVLNPAPYTSVPKEILEKCTYMTPNEIELEDMLQL